MKEKIYIRSKFKDISNFIKIPITRKGVIEQAPADIKPANTTVNSIADFLHPSTQFLKIKSVTELSRDVRQFVLEPDVSKGTGKLAYYRPGQYISVKHKIGNSFVTRPYTLCDSPKRTFQDEYIITVRNIPYGFSSDYIFNNWKKGTQIEASEPAGTFYYQPVRDLRHIVAITDDLGAASFYAMARAILDGTLNIDMTLIYGCRKKSEALFFDEFNIIAGMTNKFNVHIIFSDEKVDKCERGFITKSFIEKHTPPHKFSIFINGSTQLFNQVAPHLSAMRLERKYIRFGINGQIRDIASLPDFPDNNIGKTFICKVLKNNEIIASVPCKSEESLLVALEREGIEAPSRCRSGECGFCRAKLTKGNVFIPKETDYRRKADTMQGIIHPCISYPMSDISLSI